MRDETAMRMVGVSTDRFEQLAADERRELERRVRLYRSERALPELSDRDVVLVDDGLATGVTAEAAIHAVRELGARRVVLAAPVSAADTAARLSKIADVECLATPARFRRRRMVRRLRPDDRQRGARPPARCCGRVIDPGRASR